MFEFVSSQPRLAAVRKAHRLTQQEFADRLGVTARAYLNYESGVREAPAAVLYRLAVEFRLDPEWVLCGNDNVPRYRSDQIDRSRIATAIVEILDYSRNLPKLPPSAKIAEATIVHIEATADVARAKQIVQLAA